MDAVLNQIHHGDCVAGMHALPAGSIDLAFADPPFNIGYDYDVYDDQKEHAHYLDWSKEWIAAVHRALKPDGTFWLAIGDEYAAELKVLSQQVGFHTRSWVIWYYTFGVNCKNKFTRSHAHLFYFVKDKQKFTFNSDELVNRIPSSRLTVYADSRGNPKGRLPDDTWILRPQDLAGCFTPEEDTWFIPRVNGTFKERAGFHGCQMPEQLLGRIIRLCSHEGQTVLDPFSGSATTLAVSKKLQRQYVGFDLSEDYIARGRARLEGIKLGDPLDGAAEPTMSAPATPVGTEGKGRKNASLTPYDKIRLNAEQAEREASERVFHEGLIAAFRQVHGGFSPDRVVADPDLNHELTKVCEAMGLPGDAASWNHTLFGLRKSGKLAEFKTSVRTEFSWEDCDPFLFASEIAWQKMANCGHDSLDDILCDPDLARQFDAIASDLAPGQSSLKYRWAALMLRKNSKKTRERARLLKRQKGFSSQIELKPRDLAQIPEAPGVYLLIDRNDAPIYAGESLNLRGRAELQFGPSSKRFFRTWGASLKLKYFTTKPDIGDLLAYQSLCVKRHKPALNLSELAVS